MSITGFQKLATVSIWIFNVLLNKSSGMLQSYKLPWIKLSYIFWNNLPMENYGYEQALTS